MFSMIFFVPDSISTRTIKGVVYEVNLVELPAKRPSSSEGVTPPAKLVKSQSEAQKSVPTRRISRPKTEEKPVVIAKKTVKRPPQKVEKPKESPSKLIEEAISKLQKKVEAEKKDSLKQALSRVERKVEAQKDDHLGRALSRLESQVQSPSGEGPFGKGGGPVSGKIMDLYRLSVEEWIASNWSYPALLSSQKDEDVEAVFVLRVKNNGKIVSSRFEKRSSNPLFDQSVEKAIERSDPLPAFPEGYHETEDEIVITFNLKQLMGQ